MNVIYKMFVFVLFLVAVQVRLLEAINHQKNVPEPEKVLLDITGISNFGNVSVESKITHPDLFVPRSGIIDMEGNIYVIDYKTCEIFKFSPQGKLLKKAGGKGNGPGESIMPIRLRYAGNKLYVFDYRLPYVNIFDFELKPLEQKRFHQLIMPMDIEFINDNEFVATSGAMMLSQQHKFFIFNLDGKMKSMEVKVVDYSASSAFRGNYLNIKYPPLVSIDDKTGELWSGEICTYVIECYGKGFKKCKFLQGNLKFRLEEGNAGKNNQLKMRFPLDKGIFIKVIGGKIYYGYKYNDETLLDVITSEKIIRRFKLNNIRSIFSLIDENRLLVTFSEEDEEGDEAAFIGVIKISD
jgi:hypothetical protein